MSQQRFMSNVSGLPLPAAQTLHVVRCWTCDLGFNAFGAPWCACDNSLRTLVCPHCSSCFCLAPIPYKRKFWTDAPRAMRQHKTRFHFTPLHDTSLQHPVRFRPTSESAASLRQRVLVVDDDEPIRSLVACYVERLGYHATTSSNGEEALTLLASSEFAVVLTDALMPKMDGRELCRLAKQSQAGIKTILMTSLYKAGRFRTEARFRFGVDEYLTKPLKFAELRAAFHQVAPYVQPAADLGRTA